MVILFEVELVEGALNRPAVRFGLGLHVRKSLHLKHLRLAVNLINY